MEYKNTIELENEALKFDSFDTAELVQIFKDNHLYFPDFVYRFLLLNCFKKHIFNPANIELYSDEFKYKLRSYNFFSIHLLRKSIEEYNIQINPREFKNIFIRFYLKNEKKFNKSILLEKSLNNLSKKSNSNESIEECLSVFDSLFYTPKGYLDGLSLSIIKESIVATYSMPYLKDLGAKYEIMIPKRINKAQLLDLVTARLMLSSDERNELESKSITDIATFSKKRGFKVSPDLKKSDMVEFIIFSLNKYNEEVEKDLYNYDVLVESDNIVSTIDQDNLEQTDQSIPTSSELVDPIVVDNTNNDVSIEETVEPIEEVIEEPKEKEEVIIEEAQSQSYESIQETNEDDEPKVLVMNEPKQEEDLSRPDIYYDQTIDDEIKDIIKKYYAKKLKKDTLLRLSVITIFIVVLGLLAFFALKYYNVL